MNFTHLRYFTKSYDWWNKGRGNYIITKGLGSVLCSKNKDMTQSLIDFHCYNRNMTSAIDLIFI